MLVLWTVGWMMETATLVLLTLHSTWIIQRVRAMAVKNGMRGLLPSFLLVL